MMMPNMPLRFIRRSSGRTGSASQIQAQRGTVSQNRLNPFVGIDAVHHSRSAGPQCAPPRPQLEQRYRAVLAVVDEESNWADFRQQVRQAGAFFGGPRN
jgi:hypothetical protein